MGRRHPALFLAGLIFLGLLSFFVTKAVVAEARPAAPPPQTAPPAEPAAIAPALEPAQTPQTGYIVCLDPGHPSEVSDGMQKVNGLTETEVNWQVSLQLKKILEAAGVKVVMTKSKMDEKVTNKQRANIANTSKAHVMLRIHADAGGGTGFTIYYPRKQGTKDGVTGPSQAVMQTSAKVASEMHAAMAEKLKGKLKDNGVRGDEQSYVGQQQGAFTGSIFSQVPVILIEMCFLDNARDADWIRVEANRNLMAHAIATGAANYLKKK